jgi:dTDP-4-dehydrorhamnose reductase
MIWLIGNQGMLGRELAKKLEITGTDFVGTDREIDITDYKALEVGAAGRKFRWVINCAAYTAVDKAESDTGLARLINAVGPENIAKWCHVNDAKLIHISTDYVFNGQATSPYTENDPVSPESVYGQTKLDGEINIRNMHDKHFILRTSWLYGIYGKNFVKTMITLMNQKTELGVVNDQTGSPTWAGDLANLIAEIVAKDSQTYGTFHFSDSGEVTWYDFACQILLRAKELGLVGGECQLKPLRTEDYPTAAKRPAWSVMSKNKVTHVFGFAIPDWKDSLDIYLKETLAGDII